MIKRWNTCLTWLRFSSPSGGDQFISQIIADNGQAAAVRFRLLLAEISLYHSAKADLNKANSLVFVSFWRRSVYIGHTTYKPSNQLESFRLLLAEISLYHNMKLDLNFIKDMFSSPSGGDQFISQWLE